jgi:hypothetical protein
MTGLQPHTPDANAQTTGPSRELTTSGELAQVLSADVVCERMFRSPSSVGLLDAIFDAVRTLLRMVRKMFRGRVCAAAGR